MSGLRLLAKVAFAQKLTRPSNQQNVWMGRHKDGERANAQRETAGSSDAPTRRRTAFLDEAALALGSKPVAVAADRQHMAMVQEPVEDHHRCSQVAPLSSTPWH